MCFGSVNRSLRRTAGNGGYPTVNWRGRDEDKSSSKELGTVANIVMQSQSNGRKKRNK